MLAEDDLHSAATWIVGSDDCKDGRQVMKFLEGKQLHWVIIWLFLHENSSQTSSGEVYFTANSCELKADLC